MSHRFIDGFRAGPGWNCSSILVLLVEYIKQEHIKMSFLVMYYTKCVHPDDDQLKRSKHVAPLNTNLVVSTVFK